MFAAVILGDLHGYDHVLCNVEIREPSKYNEDPKSKE